MCATAIPTLLLSYIVLSDTQVQCFTIVAALQLAGRYCFVFRPTIVLMFHSTLHSSYTNTNRMLYILTKQAWQYEIGLVVKVVVHFQTTYKDKASNSRSFKPNGALKKPTSDKGEDKVWRTDTLY